MEIGLINESHNFLQNKDIELMDGAASAITGRSTRICTVVSAEIDNYEPGIYTERVLEAMTLFGEKVMPNFANKVQGALKDLKTHCIYTEVDENEFIDACRLVYEGVSTCIIAFCQ